MRINVDRTKKLPIYKQIENHIRAAIVSGNIQVGTKLPAVRQMSKDLAVNRITIETAYDLLEADGLIEKRVGSGTFVLPIHKTTRPNKKENESKWPLWQQGPLGRIKPKVTDLEEFNEALQPPENPIRFAGGVGDPNLFPVNEFGKIIQRVIKKDGVIGLSYGEPNGHRPLRQTICQILANQQGLQTSSENVLITTGSQQAINLVTQLLLRPGDIVLTELPSYSGALDLFKALHLHTIGVPVDEDGMQMDLVEEKLQTYHPKLIYTIPNFHNPTGVCMSGKRRRQLLALAEKYNIPILEDDYVGDLRYDGCALPTLKALDDGGRVIYTSTFSKMLMPDLRIGYIISEGPIYTKLVHLKCLNDLATSNLFQRALDSYLSIGRYQSHLRKTIRIYRKRRDCAIDTVNTLFKGKMSYSTPKGGLFLWLTLRDQINPQALIETAQKCGISLGKVFTVEGADHPHHLRINFAFQTEENIILGLQRLAQALDIVHLS